MSAVPSRLARPCSQLIAGSLRSHKGPLQRRVFSESAGAALKRPASLRRKLFVSAAIIGGVGLGTGVFLLGAIRADLGRYPTLAAWADWLSGRTGKEQIVSGERERRRDVTTRGGYVAKGELEITLYQYQTCPFSSKVRAYLDYHQIPYRKVEVNPISRSELNFSTYRKVPIVMANGKQVNDSSVIITVLESYMASRNTNCNIAELVDRHPMTEYEENGKKRQKWEGRYLITELSENERQSPARSEELHWRQWVDDVFVHCLAPNVYRSTAEAWQAFEYISKVGNFGYWESWAAQTFGATAMWALSGRLKAKYKLKDDVRESLYDYANEWVEGIGEKRPFMGGERPNLADLAMFGVLTAIEGFYAFDDVMQYSKIKPWWDRMVAVVRTSENQAVPARIDTDQGTKA